MNYDAYLRSDEAGRQFIMRLMFDKISFLERQNQLLTERVEMLERKPNHLKLIEYRSRHPPQNLHNFNGKSP